MQIEFTPQQYQTALRLKNDLPFFAAKALKIKADAGIIPLVFNRVQDYLHYRAEDQKRRIGRVRLLVIKARQQTCSEYISSRGYHRATMNPAVSVYILSHEAGSASKLFKKVVRYDEYIEKDWPQLKAGTPTANRHQREFPNGSDYTVGTAGTENTGRSDTIQVLHLSEWPQYPDPEGIKAGLLQTVSDADDTEIWWEGTAYGKNWAYTDVQKAEKGQYGDYEVVFVPWFWTDRYRRDDVPADFKRTDEEEQLAALGTIWNPITKTIDPCPLDDEQLWWRRKKIETFPREEIFKQEYPSHLEEAFQASGGSFHDSMLVEKARKCNRKGQDFSPLILGVDPGRTGDETVLTFRKGCEVEEQIVYGDMDEMRLAGIIGGLIDKRNVDLCPIDTGLGYGTIDRLHERGYSMVQGVNFQGKADDEQYGNKRAEMACRLEEWLKSGDVNLPDDNALATDIASMPMYKPTSSGKIMFPSKDDIKVKLGHSPDRYDSLLTTFAYNVRGKDQNTRQTHTKNTEKGSQLRTLARLRKPKTDRTDTGVPGQVQFNDGEPPRRRKR